MEVEMKEIRDRIKKELNLSKDPLDENSWALLEKNLPKDTWVLFLARDGAAKFLEKLPKIFQADNFFKNKDAHDSWEKIGLFFQNIGRIHEAISLHIALYDKLLSAQESKNQWIQKATPLVWMGECYSRLGFNVLSKRFLMLAHCEDSIALKGKVSPDGTGVYFRLAWGRGLPDSELKRYAKEIYKTAEQYAKESWGFAQMNGRPYMLWLSGHNLKSGRFPFRIKIKTAAMEINGRAIMLSIPIAAGQAFNFFNLAVQAFT